MRRKILAVLICTLMGIFLYACTSSTVETVETAGDVPEETEIEDTELIEPSFSFFENYIEAPKAVFNTVDDYNDIKGIYVSAPRAGGIAPDGEAYIDKYIQLINDTKLNAIVIDVKDENGNISFKNKLAHYDEMGLSINYIPRIDDLMEKLYENNIYPIARIVVFKDNAMPNTRPDLMILNQDGTVYRDNAGNSWLNPYIKENWDIALEVAQCAAMLGFKEIQFDYVRFVADARLNEDNYGDSNGVSKEEIILGFIQYAVDELHKMGVKVSADVYGTVIVSDIDAGIVGQNYVEMAKILDVICPMVYPSHYGPGYFGVQNPDLEPYKMIFDSMTISARKLAEIPENEHRAIVRPWLQAFTASYLRTGYQRYEAPQIQEQIQAVYDAGKFEWLLWNASSNYPDDMLDIFEP